MLMFSKSACKSESPLDSHCPVAFACPPEANIKCACLSTVRSFFMLNCADFSSMGFESCSASKLSSPSSASTSQSFSMCRSVSRVLRRAVPILEISARSALMDLISVVFGSSPEIQFWVELWRCVELGVNTSTDAVLGAGSVDGGFKSRSAL